MMRHPLSHLPTSLRPRLFWPLLALTLTLMVAMNLLGKPLNTAAAPMGIVSFEFAATPELAQAMLDSWGEPARLRAAFVQGLDFLFPLVYSTTIALGCAWAGDVLRRARWPLAGLSAALAWGQWLAALCDYIENVALVAIIFGVVRSPWPQIAAGFAAVKFALIFVGMVYSFYALAASIAARPARSPVSP